MTPKHVNICANMTFMTSPCLNLCLSSSKHQRKLTRGDASKTQNVATSLKQASHSTSQARIASNGNPKQRAKYFKIRRRRRFQKKYETTSSISNFLPRKGPQSIGSLTFGKCGAHPLMCLKYSIDSLNTHSKDAIYHMLAKTLKFFTTRNAMCTRQSRGLYSDCNVGQKG